MKILRIDCSPRAESQSRKLSAAIVGRLLAMDSDASVTHRDLGREPIAHPEADYAWALSSPATLAAGEAKGALRLSETLIREVEAADVLVIGTPMNNFTVPSVLKAWIDQILRVGRTIGMSAAGEKIGLLQDKPVYVGIASGGSFTGARANQPDFLTPYLVAALGCVGLKSPQFFAVQGTAFLGDEQLAADREAALAAMDVSAAGSGMAAQMR